jgi:hypothetical protein
MGFIFPSMVSSICFFCVLKTCIQMSSERTLRRSGVNLVVPPRTTQGPFTTESDERCVSACI